MSNPKTKQNTIYVFFFVIMLENGKVLKAIWKP